DLVSPKASKIPNYPRIGEFDRANGDWTLKKSRDDLLLPGRGTMWIRVDDAEGIFKIAYDYVHWADFVHDPQRTWQEVTWVGRRLFMTRRELADRFFEGKMDLASKVPLDHTLENEGDKESQTPSTEGQAKATIYEIWDKRSKQVYFIARDAQVPLEVAPPYINLDGFWPCPEPMFATLTPDDLVPTPDYAFYQDQAEEIDTLTARIASVSDSLKVVGFYSAGAGDATTAIETALKPGVENKMIPVESWAVFGESGSSGGIVWLPIETVAAALREIISLRQTLIGDVFQITGIADIMRGDTSAEETLGAQQLKSQWGSIRMKDKQQAMVRFAAEAFKISGEIIAERFPPQQLLAMANVQETDDPAIVQQAVMLLQNERLRPFRIDIQADSTIYPDEQAEKAARNEFIGAVGNFFQTAAPTAQMMPELLPLMGQLLTFTVRGYRAGRELEQVIEQAMGQAAQGIQQRQQAQQQQAAAQQQAELAAKQPPPPDPAEQARAQQEMDLKAREMALKENQANFDMGMREDEYLANALGQLAPGDSMDPNAPGGGQPAGPRQPKTPVAQALGGLLQSMQEQQMQNQQMMAQMLQAMQAQTAAVQQSMQMVAQVLAAPKQVIYGPNGEILGSQPVLDQPQAN
ncbi:MAG TPA: hypothetical protein PLF26_13090, partial [Blastocatellia bacterium]|nr:hypothetical protein [Blastocatellia bacterium]